jgi:hypothetical protein
MESFNMFIYKTSLAPLWLQKAVSQILNES